MPPCHGPISPYNPVVAHALLSDFLSYLDFTEADVGRLAALRPRVAPRLSRVVDAFYQRLLSHPQARAIFTGGKAQLDRQRRALRQWLLELFEGTYDLAYYERHAQIGRAHVRVQLPQHYMVTSMNVIRIALISELNTLVPPVTLEDRLAVNKVLDLDLAIMLDSYLDDTHRQLRAIEHARFEARLSESEHLARVGQLAASLAHEIKNPLAGISGALQIIGAGLDIAHPHKEVIVEALNQIDRLDAAVKDLLIYARPRPPVKSPQPIAALVQRSLTLLREEPSMQAVRIRIEPLTRDAIAAVDDAQIQQVLANLLLNAAHACERDAEITCKYGEENGWVRIDVIDAGRGMSAEVVARAFEPFFTTKSKGTGLGLAICRRIVEAHGGTIDLESRPGAGTRVAIRLPKETESPRERAAAYYE